ncbi:MAG: DapH/DapD/GlmU-related protein [Corynebacterium sp.]|nr:DapH/DapD/GlmU-related protein [Corynebacterium sp.]
MQSDTIVERFRAIARKTEVDPRVEDYGEILGLAMERSMRYWMLYNSSYMSSEERRALLQEYWATEIPESTRVIPPFTSDGGLNITVGERVFINSGCRFQDLGGIHIEDDVFIGHNVVLATINHDQEISRRAVLYPKPIVIRKNAWIGANATITAGVEVGEGAIVAAGAVVTRDVAPGAIVGGVPAHTLKKIPMQGD